MAIKPGDRGHVAEHNLIDTRLDALEALPPGTSDPAVAALVADPESDTGAALNAAYGAVAQLDPAASPAANGATLTAAIAAANGATLRIPAGTYAIGGVTASVDVDLRLDAGATLVHQSAATSDLFTFTGERFVIAGGTIDGNKANQTGRPNIITGALASGQFLSVNRTDFVNTVRAAVYLTNFGGQAFVTNCTFNGQAQHDGTAGHMTAIVYVESGQNGAKGLLRYKNNDAFGTVSPALPGSNPGGVFFAPTLDYAAGIGNFSTIEASGNYFYGYGQNCGGNDIAPLHTYPSTMGARFTDNYFEQSSFSAISAKSVEDFVCTGNFIGYGQTSTQNVATEGALSYAPGYHSGSTARPRAVITGNIVVSPGGQPGVTQDGIVITGTPTSLGADIICSHNIINGAGNGIRAAYLSTGLETCHNNIVGGTGNTAGTQNGLRFDQISGDVRCEGNTIVTPNGSAIYGLTGLATARFMLNGGLYNCTGTGYGVLLRGVALAKFSGTTLQGTNALSIAASGSTRVGQFAWDSSNTLIGNAGITYADIDKCTGDLFYTGSPVGVVVPGEVGTTYRQTNGSGATSLWIATGTTSASWAQALAGASPGAAGLNRMVGYTFDPTFATAGNAIGAAGVLFLSKVILLGGGSISKVWFHLTTAGTSLTSGQCFMVIYDAAGNLLGQTPDMSAQLGGATGQMSVALTAATVSLAAGAEVNVGILWNGTGTAPALRGMNGTGFANIGISAAIDSRNATAGTGLTAVPSSMPTKVAAFTAPFFGLA